MSKKHIIIGAGSAGISALETIRGIAPQDQVTLFTKESFLPYSPTALPYLLSGRIAKKDLPMRDDAFFASVGATLAKGKEVVELRPGQKEIVLDDSTVETYDSLLLATGSAPVTPRIKGIEAIGYSSFHHLGDCERLLTALEGPTKEVMVLGAGLVGMEVAAALLEKGHRVQIVEREQSILPLYFDVEAEPLIRKKFIAHGAQIFTGETVIELEKRGDRIIAKLSGAGAVEADLLVCAVGVQSNTSLARKAGVKTNRGILVDERMRTSIPDVYAAGDVAEARNFFTGEPGMNLIIPSAVNQGEIAGANMAGNEEKYEGWVSKNVFHFFDGAAYSLGQAMARDSGFQVIEQKDYASGSFKKLVCQEGVLVGAMFINVEVDPGVILYLIKEKVNIERYREALFNNPGVVSLYIMMENERREAIPSYRKA